MIERVLAPNPGPMTGTGTNTWLVDNGRGELAVIDPGPADTAHLNAIQSVAQSLGRITTVLVTHRHSDHLPGARPLCERTGASLLGHADLPGVDRALVDREVAFGSLQALATPGHTRESLCYWDPDTGSLFTGDLVAGVGTVIVDDQPGGLSQYMASLERLVGLSPRTIYPGHGPIVADAVGKLREYLAHRRGREQQVLDALGSGPATVDELVSSIYVDVPTNLTLMAARNVRAQLEKLGDESRVTSRGDRWQLSS